MTVMSRDLNDFMIHRASPSDAPAIGRAHAASIREQGPAFYTQDIIDVWGRDRNPQGYVNQMENHGEIFFVAQNRLDDPEILGFGSYIFEQEKHRLAGLYVRGTAARRGVATALLRAVEDVCRANAAKILHVEGSLAAEAFYLKNGFSIVTRGERLMGGLDNGINIAVVHMKKGLL